MPKNLTHFKNIIDEAFPLNLEIKNEFIFFLKKRLQFKDSDIFANIEKTLTNKEEELINNFFEKKQKKVPLDYILKSTEFFEEDFYVDHRVLIPRPETELLVDFINKYHFSENIKILDAGTGSGCIGISIALKNPKFKVYGSDYYVDSLDVANINKKKLCADNFYLINSDWLSCFNEHSLDVVVSNPPYISENDPHLKNLRYEPKQALIASDNGLHEIIKISEQSKKILQKNGMLIFEHGFNQHAEVTNILKKNGFSKIRSLSDYQNHYRFTLGII